MPTYDELTTRLRSVKQFDALSNEVLEYVVKSGDLIHFKKDEFLFHEGHPCAGLFVLVQGQVALFKTGPQGKMSLLNILYPVIMFNEVAALDGGYNPVSSIAHNEVTVWKVGTKKFQNLIREFPDLGLSLLQVLAKRNRMLIAHYDDLSFRTIEARLAKYLVEISMHGAKVINRGDLPIKVIAARIVTTPEAVSRTLKQFKENGLIECNRQKITILDVARLSDRAQIPF